MTQPFSFLSRAFLSHLHRGLFLLAILGAPYTAHAVQHTVYIPFIGEDYDPQPDSADDHSYLTEIRRLREALTDEIPDLEMEGAVGGEPLRITRDDEGISRIVLSSLNRDNTGVLQSVTLIVRNSDLQVIGFINDAAGRDTFFRLAERTIREDRDNATGRSDPTYIRSAVTWPGTRSHDLNLSYDYPEIERRARIGRYTNTLRISTSMLRRDIGTLSEFSPMNIDRESMRDMAASLLRVLTAYFEALRFRNIANDIHNAGINEGGTWTMGENAAVLSDNWSSLSEFGSQSSFAETDTRPALFQPVAQDASGWSHVTSYLVSSRHRARTPLSRSISWDAVMAVVDGFRFWAAMRGVQDHAFMRYHSDPYGEDDDEYALRRRSCPQMRGGSRKGSRKEKREKRSIVISVSPYDLDPCPETDPLLGRIGNMYFMRHTLDGVLNNIVFM